MPNMKAIKRRRLTVKNISQITKAMNLVATSKLQRARNALTALQSPVRATFDIVYNTVGHPDALEHTLMQPRVVKNVAYVVITGNRGLCGGYNSNVSKELMRHAREKGINPMVIPVGTKGRDYLRRRGYNVEENTVLGDTPSYEDADTIAGGLVEMYTNGVVDEVYVVYTKFVTVLNLLPITRKVLPIDPAYLRRVVADELNEDEIWEDLGFFPQPETKAQKTNSEIEFEPGLAEVLANAIPWYMSMFVYAAMTSAVLCEHAARMTSMDSSTKNAGDIIEKLTLQYNRQRQSIITQEITEIVSGANALQ